MCLTDTWKFNVLMSIWFISEILEVMIFEITHLNIQRSIDCTILSLSINPFLQCIEIKEETCQANRNSYL